MLQSWPCHHGGAATPVPQILLDDLLMKFSLLPEVVSSLGLIEEPAWHLVMILADNRVAVKDLPQMTITVDVAQCLRLVEDLYELPFYQSLLNALGVAKVKDAGLVFLTTTGDTTRDLELCLWVWIRPIKRVKNRIKD